MSGMRVAFPKTQRTWCFDAFPRYRVLKIITMVSNTSSVTNFCYVLGSIDKVSKVTSPVLVIHGTEDEVIDFSHGIAIHDKCPKAVEPLWVEVRTFSKEMQRSVLISFFCFRELVTTTWSCTVSTWRDWNSLSLLNWPTDSSVTEKAARATLAWSQLRWVSILALISRLMELRLWKLQKNSCELRSKLILVN